MMEDALSEPMNTMASAIFFGSADSLARKLCLEEICFVFLRLGKAVEHSRFHRTRANDVDPNAGAGEFDGRRHRDAFHGVFAAVFVVVVGQD